MPVENHTDRASVRSYRKHGEAAKQQQMVRVTMQRGKEDVVRTNHHFNQNKQLLAVAPQGKERSHTQLAEGLEQAGTRASHDLGITQARRTGGGQGEDRGKGGEREEVGGGGRAERGVCDKRGVQNGDQDELCIELPWSDTPHAASN
jgi:hypothetical protein